MRGIVGDLSAVSVQRETELSRAVSVMDCPRGNSGKTKVSDLDAD